MSDRFTPLREFLSEFGTNTDLWIINLYVEEDEGQEIIVLCGEPHPYNEPVFSMWLNGVKTHTFDDISEARKTFATLTGNR